VPLQNYDSIQFANLHCSIKAKKARGFGKPAMFHKVMRILEAHHFRLPVCRFVLDLFDRSVLQQIVLDEEEEGSEDESSGESGSDAEGNRNRT
jgi:rapamycin-insensitive companion of mTOR